MKLFKAFPYCKGQIWMVEEPRDVTNAWLRNGTNCQLKSRPYLIYLSKEDAQLSFNVIQGFPISSNDKFPTKSVTGKTFYDFDVRFINPRGEVNRVITGQLTTIDTRYLCNYMYTVPDEIMKEIDKMMMRRFGLGGGLINMSQQITELEARLAELKEEAAGIFNTFNYEVNKQGNMIPVSLRTPTTETPKEPEEEKKDETPVKVEPQITNTEVPNVSYTKKGRIRWDTATMLALEADLKNLGDQRTAIKWGFTQTQLMNRKIYIRQKLSGKK